MLRDAYHFTTGEASTWSGHSLARYGPATTLLVRLCGPPWARRAFRLDPLDKSWIHPRMCENWGYEMRHAYELIGAQWGLAHALSMPA